ncbi:MAG: DUF3783 domain-containing protein [Lachnospiraceae bacterium]
MKRETIYLYRVDDPQTVKNIQFMAVRLKIRVKRITEEMTGLKIGYITGLEGYTDEITKEEFAVPQEPVMLMQNFTDRKIDQLLHLFRTAGIPRIALKAMLTDYNKDWYFYQLYEELCREHESFNQKD